MAVDDTAFQALDDLRASIVKELTARATALPRIRRVTVPGSVPALALAYDLYEDARRDEALARRNGVRHPGFMPRDTEIEALTE